MKVEELVYGFKGNETYLTLYLKKVEQVNFSQLENRAGVYMIYSNKNELMYIGETTSLKRRIITHLGADYGKEEINKDTVSHILYAYLDEDRYERGVIEGLLVHKYRPALNCNDAMVGESRSKVDPVVAQEVIYYAKNTEIADHIIAKALNVDNGFVNNIRNKGYLNHVILPKGYTPKTVITQEFIDENSAVKQNSISRTTFFEIRELIERGSMKQIEIARKFSVEKSTVTRIKNLHYPKYRKWEEQRIGKAVA